jgi:hypothetical protein
MRHEPSSSPATPTRTVGLPPASSPPDESPVAEAPTRPLHERSAQADITFPEPRIHSPGGCGTNYHLRTLRQRGHSGLRPAPSPPVEPPVAEAPTRPLHERSAQADITFPEPRIHSPGQTRHIRQRTRHEPSSFCPPARVERMNLVVDRRASRAERSVVDPPVPSGRMSPWCIRKPRPERVNPPLGKRQALSRADALCEQGFTCSRGPRPALRVEGGAGASTWQAPDEFSAT